MVRNRETAELITAIKAGTSVLVHGEPGVGKSWLAREVASALGRSWHVEQVAGTAATSNISFSASSHLLPPFPVAAEPALVATIIGALAERAGDRRLLLVADDLNRLDQGTIAVVHQLLSQGGSVLATARTTELDAAAVEPVWKQEWATPYQLDNIDREEFAELITGVLDVASPALEAELWRLSEGNPLATIEIVREANAAGLLEPSPDGLALRGALPVPRAALDLVRSRRESYELSTQRALDIVALVEPLHHHLATALDLTDAIGQLEHDGLAISTVENGSVVVRCAHPLLGDAARAQVSTLRQAEICGELIDALDVDDAALGRLDVLRLSRLALDIDAPIRADVRAAAASQALGIFDVATATRLIEPLGPDDRTTATHLIDGRCRLYAGDIQAATAAFSQAEAAATDEVQAAAAISAQAEVALFLRNDPIAARDLLTAGLDQTTDVTARGELAAMLGLAAGVTGDFGPALRLGDELLDTEQLRPTAELSIIVANTLAQGMTGPVSTAEKRLERGFTLAPPLRGANPVAETQLGLNAMFVDFANLDLAAAIDRGRAGLATAQASGLPTAEWRVVLANCLLLADGASESLQLTSDGWRELDDFDPFGLQASAVAFNALAAARLGDAETAERVLREADALPNIAETRSRIWRDLAEAELLALSDLAAAARSALAVAERATDESHHVWAAIAAHVASTFGAPSVTDLLDTISGRANECLLVTTLASAAHARAREDLTALDAAADALWRGGYARLAVDCAVAAHDLDQSEHGPARRAVGLHSLLTEATSELAPRPDVPADPLTGREREIALAAAEGQSSRAIADTLYVSVRTVDNHLGRIYGKLGVTSRSELDEVLAP